MKRLLLAGAMALVLATPGLARDNWAILIGAAHYDNLPERFWLKGPINDIALVSEFLRTGAGVPFADDHMLVLADGVEGAGRPTLAAIRAAFSEVAARAGPGDFVYLHFSGHGTQAPALDPSTELDGLDELFLPVDIGVWNDQVGEVENALVDDEIGKMIDSIRAKGADVWAVFDSCHSGTVTRAAPSGDDEVATRQLSPEALGIPEARIDAAMAEATEQSRGLDDPRAAPDAPLTVAEPDGMGSLVAFFAAQTTETTPEKRLPANDPDRKPMGVFTYAVFETLAERPGITYRQLAQEVLRKYAVKNLTRTTPLFEGALDRVVFGGAETDRVQQWPTRAGGADLAIDAGRLHGLAPGERLAVLASPADATGDALGEVEVVGLETFSARLAPADGLDAAAIPKGAVVRKIEDAVDFTLTVALPEGADSVAGATRAAAALLAVDGEGRLRFVEPGAEADLRLAVIPDSARPDAVWILPATGLVEDTTAGAPPSVSTGDKSVEELAATLGDDLARMAKAINLMRIGAAAASSGLEVSAELLRARFDPATEEVDDSARTPLDSASVPRLIPDDVVGARLENRTTGPVDFNILYVGSDYAITWMGNGRLHPGDVLDEDFLRVTDDAFGRDRMVVVLTPALERTEVEDLSFLEQDAVETTRGVAPGPLEAALMDAGFGETTRAAVGLRKKDAPERRPMILQFDLDTVPAPAN